MQPSLTAKILSVIVLIAMAYGVFRGGQWLFSKVVPKLMPFDAGSLALVSLALILIPIALMFIASAISSNAASSPLGWVAIGSAQIGVMGLIVSALWYLGALIWKFFSG